MASKLDQPLDDMIKTRRKSTRRVVRGKASTTTPARTRASAAPVGGVSKSTKATKQGKNLIARPTVPVSGIVDSKIIVTGLPADVTEQQIKDYFAKTIGPVKKVFLTYGPSGQSRGISTIVFSKPGSAAEAAAQLNGVKVDNRAMKIEVVVGADQAPIPVPVKALGERIVQSKPKKTKATTKSQPKSAVAAANSVNARGSGRARRGRNTGRGKPKTAEELDAEMTDYFDTGVNPAAAAEVNQANGAGQPTAAALPNADAGMDEIM